MSAPATRPLMRGLARAIVRLLTRTTVSGVEHVPAGGPLIVVFNHLGHLDAAVLIAGLPVDIEAIALADLLRVPVTGFIMRLYGVIPVHRDDIDHKLIKRALQELDAGRVLALAPEGRMSLTGALEQARGGAAYLALKSKAPILPIALTGSENRSVYGAWKRLRRPHITATIGEPLRVPDAPLSAQQRKTSLEQTSTLIMTRLARLLPAEYRGVYAGLVD